MSDSSTGHTPRLALPEIAAAQAQKHVTHNDALARLDVIVQMAVVSAALTVPPTSPAEGALYVVADGATGAWGGQDGAVASWRDDGWTFFTPGAGWLGYDMSAAQLIVHDGAAWQAYAAGGLPETIARLGVGATPDDTNLFALQSPALLHSAVPVADGGSGDARLVISKEALPNTASVVFQTEYSGRAEFGLTGSDAFALKVSPDDATWTDSLAIDPTTAIVEFAHPPTRAGHAIPDAGVAIEAEFDRSDLGDHLLWFRASDGAPLRITAADLKTQLSITGGAGDGTPGADGTDGTDGASFLTGEGIPALSLGQDGDSYLDRQTGALYARSSGAWAATGQSLMGADGIPGLMGPSGPVGPAGAVGLQGPPGAAGKSFSPDAAGLAADRAAHDGEAFGFSFLSTDTNQVSWKQSATSGDWSGWAEWGGASSSGASGAGSTTPLGMFVAASL